MKTASKPEPWFAVIQWPLRILGVGIDLKAAQKSAGHYLKSTVSAEVPQISWGTRHGEIRWAYIAQGFAEKARPGKRLSPEVRIDMLRTLPGWVIERPLVEGE